MLQQQGILPSCRTGHEDTRSHRKCIKSHVSGGLSSNVANKARLMAAGSTAAMARAYEVNITNTSLLPFISS